MKKLKFLLVLLFVIVIVFVFKNQIFNSIVNHKIIMELNEEIIESPGNDPEVYSDEFLNKIRNWGDYSVIGLGEATHGTRNFFKLKQRLFKYLVENHGFKTLAYEFSFQKSLKVNDYVLYGKGCVDSLFMGELWIQDNEEELELIRWMQAYNSDKNDVDKIQFIGIDNQLDAYTPVSILKYFEHVSPNFRLAYPQIIYKIKNLEAVKYREISKSEYLKRERIYHEFYKLAKTYFKEHPISSSNMNTEILLHLIESLIQSNDFLYRYAIEAYNLRDYQLATNVIWVKKYMRDAGVAVWAQNAHIAKDPNLYSDGKGGGAMGTYLQDILGKEYLAVATGFSVGRFKAVTSDSLGKDTKPLTFEIKEIPPKNAVNYLFHKLQYPNFVLNIDQIKRNSRLYDFLNELKPMLGVGDWYAGNPKFHYSGDRIINLVQAHDVLFYFKDTDELRIFER